MTATEIAAARLELALTPEALADLLSVKGTELRQWETGQKDAPRWVAKHLAWLLEMHRREGIMKSSGLAECPWVTSWEAIPEPEDLGELRTHYDALKEHAAHCPTCEAREQYAAKHLGPMPPIPGGRWLKILEPVGKLMAALPAWARPAAGGALFMFALVGFRMLIALPIMIVAGRFRLAQVPMALGPLAAASAAGAVGGIGYTFGGKPLRGIPFVGPYLAGIVTVAAYCLGLIWLAPIAFNERLVNNQADVVIWSIMVVVFGCVFGHAGLRTRSGEGTS